MSESAWRTEARKALAALNGRRLTQVAITLHCRARGIVPVPPDCWGSFTAQLIREQVLEIVSRTAPRGGRAGAFVFRVCVRKENV